MSWRRITLSRAEYEAGEVILLLGMFKAAYIHGNGPEGMAMYGCWNGDGSRYFVYTTPRSARYIVPMLHAYSAKLADSPDPTAVSLIFGNDADPSAFLFELEA